MTGPVAREGPPPRRGAVERRDEVFAVGQGVSPI